MADLRTPAEIKYDAERAGQLYAKPAANQDDELTALLTDMYGDEREPVLPANPSPQLLSLLAWSEEQLIAEWIDQQRPADEPEDTDAIIRILEEIDGGE